MGDIRLILLVVAIVAFNFQMDGTNGLFYHTSRSFSPGASQPLSSEQEHITNEDFPMPPFLPFFSFFRHRNPFVHVPHLEEKNNDGVPSGKVEDSKVNNTMRNKTKETAGIMENDRSGNKTSNLRDQSVSRNQKVSTPYPLKGNPKKSLLEIFPMYHFRQWRIGAHGSKMTEDQTSTATILSNSTGMALNNSMMVDAENCTRRQFITRYFFVWTINWASLITHLTVILLITALVTCALILCRPYCETGEQRTKLFKAKPLFV